MLSLRGCLKSSRRCESVEHDAKACDVDHSLRRLHCVFVAFAESAIATEPSEASLYNPGQTSDLESALPSFDDLHSCESVRRLPVARKSTRRVLPHAEIVIHGAPGRELPRKKAPLATGAEQIENRVDHSSNIGCARAVHRAEPLATVGRVVPKLRRSNPWDSHCLSLLSFTNPQNVEATFSNTLLN
jgi:hypothetical protein